MIRRGSSVDAADSVSRRGIELTRFCVRFQAEEKYQALQDKYDLLEQKLQCQTDLDSPVKQNGVALSPNLNGSSMQAYSNSPNTDDKLHQLQSEYDDLKMELTRVCCTSHVPHRETLDELLSGTATRESHR